jgi:hypothetical protein
MRALVLSSILLLLPAAALSNTISQKGSYKDAGLSYEITFDWQISTSGFRLETTRSGEKKQFIHNGKVFYVCGKLAKNQLDVLRTLDIQDPKLLSNLEKGACQELSTDFTVRFFLSPWDAVTSVETGGGFGSGMTADDPEIMLTGKASQAAGMKCVEFTRKYSLGNKNHPSMAHAVEESACNASAVKWRQSFTRALGMTLIRRPGGKPLNTAVTNDVKKMAGISLTMDTKVKGKDSAGKTYEKTFSVQTTSASAGDVETPTLPAGYEVIDPQNLALLAAKSKVKSASGAAKDNIVADALKFLLLGGNPATTVFKNLTDDTDNKK